MENIDELIRRKDLRGCTIDRCIDGTVWVHGNTYRYRYELKKAGFKWNPDVRAWWRKESAEESAPIVKGWTDYSPWNDLDYALGY